MWIKRKVFSSAPDEITGEERIFSTTEFIPYEEYQSEFSATGKAVKEARALRKAAKDSWVASKGGRAALALENHKAVNVASMRTKNSAKNLNRSINAKATIIPDGKNAASAKSLMEGTFNENVGQYISPATQGSNAMKRQIRKRIMEHYQGKGL